jgi:transketolase
MTTERELSELAIQTIRGLSMDAVQAANSGHPGTPMALAPLGWVLFSGLRRHDPAHPEWPDRDRFVLSCGHASMLQYALLHLSGYPLSLDDIKAFRQLDSLTPGHPEVHHTPGVETTTGPLGQGLATAVGMAMAERHLAVRFNRDGHTLFDHRTWVIASDGDLMEGVAAEAASLAGHLKLSKLVVFWDDNRITIDGSTDLAFTEDVLARFAAYGWHTASVEDGNDVDALTQAAEAASADPRPSLVRVRTIIGYPAPNKQNSAAAHGAPLGADEVAATKEAMGWPQDAFHVPVELAAATEAIRTRGAKAHAAWTKRVDAYAEAHPELAAELERVLVGRLPDGWSADLPTFDADPKGVATRKASGKILAALTPRLPELCGGSADLTGSNNTELPGEAFFHEVPDGAGPDRVPRQAAWGVREHAMGAAVNGMALHGGVIPFGATFLIFSDYMRPALRLAALMNAPTRYVFTHDSIGLGEDGPTHQPVEHLAALRAIPNFTVLRPADANEVRECWRVALERSGPAALVLTRQNLPVVDRSKLASAEGTRRGGYVLADANGELAVILIATGSEVALALTARDALEDEGIGTRVVSMPSVELFEEQPEGYRNRVLPPSVKARVAIEAGVRQGWDRYVGPQGAYVTLDRFGASAPAPALFAQFGFTPERVVEAAKQACKR